MKNNLSEQTSNVKSIETEPKQMPENLDDDFEPPFDDLEIPFEDDLPTRPEEFKKNPKSLENERPFEDFKSKKNPSYEFDAKKRPSTELDESEIPSNVDENE